MTIKMHISQKLDGNYLHADGDEGMIEIETKLHENGARIAIKATEYTISESDEAGEYGVDVASAVIRLVEETGNCKPGAVDGQYAVLDGNTPRVLAWLNDEGNMSTLQIFDTYEDSQDVNAIEGTGNTEHIRRFMLLKALKLEIEHPGMKMTKGPSAYSKIKTEFELTGNKQKVLDQFTKIVEAHKPY